MSKEKLLISGSKGLVGELLVEKLGKNYDLILIDRLVPNHDDKNNYFQADISEYLQLEEVFESLGQIGFAIHLAADPNHMAGWRSVSSNNIDGTWNFYTALHKHNQVKRVVFASSNHVTGRYEYVDGSVEPNLCMNKNTEMISTNSKLRPDGPYGISKVAGEAIARYYYDLYEIESVCLRIGSVIKDNNPEKGSREECTWLSHEDLAQLIDCSLRVEVNPEIGKFSGFGIYYGVSNNKHRFWDIENARKELSYDPQDDASRE